MAKAKTTSTSKSTATPWSDLCPGCRQPTTYRTSRFDGRACRTCLSCNYEEVECGFSVVVDSREGLPYAFGRLQDNTSDGRSPRLVVPIVRKALQTGDYSLLGYEDSITLERKSREDLWSSISQSRDNFVGRLERMETFSFAAIIVEASWDELLRPNPFTDYTPKSLSRTIQSWILRYSARWLMMPDRAYAEAITFRLLQRFFLHRQEESRFTGELAP